MVLTPRLDLKQSQTLVMTPQLQQAIKLLTLSGMELQSHIAELMADNPLVDVDNEAQAAQDPVPQDTAGMTEAPPADAMSSNGEAALDIAPDSIDSEVQTGEAGFGPPGGSASADWADNDSVAERETTLAGHLHAQIGMAGGQPVHQFIARNLIDQLDDAGYLRLPLQEIATMLGVRLDDVEQALRLVQSLDPTGVGARDLAECLTLQAIEADRYDPCMQALLGKLDLLAQGAMAQLCRCCGVDRDELAQMISELRAYDPKPGSRFGEPVLQPVTPEVLVRRTATGWDLAINLRTLSRLVVDREYYTQLKTGCTDKASASWLNTRLADADWLAKALDQRQKTILKVATEIVRRQERFFAEGPAALIPLTLREVADAVELHESTVSRVTANKYLNCGRGTFELKYFFSSGVTATNDEGAASAEAVRTLIRQIVQAEQASDILSDDALVTMLEQQGFSLARRTVAKYRESIGIGSSVQRRRQKRIAGER
ncbi:RNA polymerase factor sigma-54 [Croceicoccus sp. F390]|uniref:RNA polymerase sigma-54 factor n=1 Tax=Croceicoccus esteveae TaxID=3075597 RepID=A0ABU2ZEE2_9SPHN|nr:RNA polymerase factor sigma-54 [Croceicoccus sp. F390]MDT0574581.1 RNA polymerase factor sigma-54 [Croceicoccus sp. F390]